MMFLISLTVKAGDCRAGHFRCPGNCRFAEKDKAIAEKASLGAGWLDGVKDWWQHKWLSARCALIGVIVGVIPGLGGSVVDWIAYGHTVQTTKDKAGFGKGDVRGVIGPESSNNAKEGGGLVPTLLFGIPGSGSMAIFDSARWPCWAQASWKSAGDAEG